MTVREVLRSAAYDMTYITEKLRRAPRDDPRIPYAAVKNMMAQGERFANAMMKIANGTPPPEPRNPESRRDPHTLFNGVHNGIGTARHKLEVIRERMDNHEGREEIEDLIDMLDKVKKEVGIVKGRVTAEYHYINNEEAAHNNKQIERMKNGEEVLEYKPKEDRHNCAACHGFSFRRLKWSIALQPNEKGPRRWLCNRCAGGHR